jgi:hypothetical protein
LLDGLHGELADLRAEARQVLPGKATQVARLADALEEAHWSRV